MKADAARSLPSAATAAWALIAWAAVSVALTALAAPEWLRLPVVGLFALTAVGAAAVLALRIRQVPVAIATAVSVGVSSLIVASELVIYAGTWSPFRALTLQALAVAALSAIVLLRPRQPGGRP